ncbi:hypothetical protein Slin14017_G002590 [Septoria linicola]|nr:hypothetical protein Slin14017_G002590 [Septoria linicola]
MNHAVARTDDQIDFWYLWYDLGTNRGYLILSRSDYPPISDSRPWPWPLDKDTGEPSYCSGGSNKLGTVLVPVQAYDASSDYEGSDEDIDHGDSAWTESDHIILCPQSFNVGRPDDFLEPEYDDAILGDMEIAALTLFHEIWHFLFKGRWAPDYKAMPPVRDADVSPSSLWPMLKAGYRTDYELDVSGALQSMQLAQYEVASPATLTTKDMRTWRCPECYAWFGRAYYLSVKAQQDWSSGVLRPHGNPFSGPTASAPEEKRAAPTTSARSFWPY